MALNGSRVKFSNGERTDLVINRNESAPEGGGEGNPGSMKTPPPLSIGVGVNYYAHRQEMSAEAGVVIN